eukprot:TRINITY_DN15574_c0_g1_i1.p1 TRINITY_DN15574_c0_g1~~TRINITY_DN15574_c0_g1_i1.p1  ORF type:complete len:675 (-),score=191.75 TRINITY_DN15574_c0_g1_i1:437-2461(-)
MPSQFSLNPNKGPLPGPKAGQKTSAEGQKESKQQKKDPGLPKEKKKDDAKNAKPDKSGDKDGKKDGKKDKEGKADAPEGTQDAEEVPQPSGTLDDLMAELADEDSENEEAAKTSVQGRLFCIPRDAERILQITVIEGEPKSKVEPIFPDLGKKEAKYVAVSKGRTPYFFSVPYNNGKMLKLDPISCKVQEVGKHLGYGKDLYTNCAVCGSWTGRLYAAPCRAERCIEIDPDTGEAREIGPKLGDSTKSKYFCIALHQNNRLYAIPYDARRVLMIWPVSEKNFICKEVGPDLGELPGKYRSVAKAPNGELYAAPNNAQKVLRIDIQGDVSLVGPDFGEREKKYSCLITAPNKLLYAPPLYAEKVLEINCQKGQITEIGEKLGAGEAKYACGAVGANGHIYCAPLEARQVLEIRCVDHEVHYFGMDIGTGAEKYSSIAAAPIGGKLFAAPREGRKLLEIDTVLETVKEVGKDLGACPRKYTCIVAGLTHLEIKQAGRERVMSLTKAAERAERAWKFAFNQHERLVYQHKDLARKLRRQEELVKMAEEELEQAALAAQEMEDRIANYPEPTTKAQQIELHQMRREVVELKNDTKDFGVKLLRKNGARDNASEDLNVVAQSLAFAQGKMDEKRELMESAQAELDEAIGAADNATIMEREARKQAAETAEELQRIEREH